MNYATIVHEMYDDFGDGLGVEQTPTVPPVPMDQELWAFDKKAKDANRLPARVFAKWFAAEVIGDQTTANDFGLERHPLQKSFAVRGDDEQCNCSCAKCKADDCEHCEATPRCEQCEQVAISPELNAAIERIVGISARAAWKSTRGRLVSAVAQPMQKRAASAAFCSDPDLLNANPHFDQGRKVLSVTRQGKALITKFEGGERWEIVED